MPNSHPALLCLQIFVVAFLGLHDWIPLAPLNDVKAARRENPGAALIVSTVLGTLPFAFGLAASACFVDGPWPGWLLLWLRISYALLFAGALRAWWVPYLIKADPVRAARYRSMFGRTLTFLPQRNGISPNVLHAMLHLAIAATLALLFVASA